MTLRNSSGSYFGLDIKPEAPSSPSPTPNAQRSGLRALASACHRPQTHFAKCTATVLYTPTPTTTATTTTTTTTSTTTTTTATATATATAVQLLLLLLRAPVLVPIRVLFQVLVLVKVLILAPVPVLLVLVLVLVLVPGLVLPLPVPVLAQVLLLVLVPVLVLYNVLPVIPSAATEETSNHESDLALFPRFPPFDLQVHLACFQGVGSFEVLFLLKSLFRLHDPGGASKFRVLGFEVKSSGK